MSWWWRVVKAMHGLRGPGVGEGRCTARGLDAELEQRQGRLCSARMTHSGVVLLVDDRDGRRILDIEDGSAERQQHCTSWLFVVGTGVTTDKLCMQLSLNRPRSNPDLLPQGSTPLCVDNIRNRWVKLVGQVGNPSDILRCHVCFPAMTRVCAHPHRAVAGNGDLADVTVHLRHFANHDLPLAVRVLFFVLLRVLRCPVSSQSPSVCMPLHHRGAC